MTQHIETAHKRVFEYDGSYKCLDCQATWGAFMDAPEEPPAECVRHTETATPRTDATQWDTGLRCFPVEQEPDMVVPADFARRLEIEIAMLQETCNRLTGMKFSNRMHAALISRAEIAETERDTLRTQLAEAQGNLIGANASISQLNQMLGWKGKELAQAQNDALERAAKACEKRIGTCFDANADPQLIHAADEEAHACAEAIRELKLPPNSAEGEPG